VDQIPDSSLKNVSLRKLQRAARMGFILVLGILSLAIFVAISNTVFSMAARLRTASRRSGLQTRKQEDDPSFS